MRHTVVLMVGLGLAACSKGASDKPGATGQPAATPAIAEQAPRRKLESLAVTLPDGWTRAYADTDVLVFTSPALPDGRHTVTRIDHAGGRAVATAQEFVQARIEHHWDPGVTAEVLHEDRTSSGFAATVRGTTPVDPKHPKLEYYAIWKVADQVLICECEWVPDEVIRDQIAALCSSAHF